jgi:DNA-binding XRE family transcriptional regulator
MTGSQPDAECTPREFREYFASSWESQHNLAARIGVTEATFRNLLIGKRQPKPTTYISETESVSGC